ncbi:MAG: hypothetical protein K2G82_05495 [Paramuribaculum sp.]|nr:hypothetical protein [Paramuribaculum sp.]
MTHTADNAFSTSRAIAYSRMFPTIKQHLAIYTAGAFILFTAAMILSDTTIGLLFSQILMSAISMAIYLSPRVFGIGSSPMAEGRFPATKHEKAAMMTGYTFVILPAAICAAALLATLFARIFVDGASICNLIPSHQLLTPVYSVVQYLSTLLPTSICLLAVVSYRRHRVLMPIVWTVATLIAISLITAIVAIVTVLGFKRDLLPSIDHAAPQQEEIARIMFDILMPVMWWYFALSIIATAVIIILAIRKIRDRQL